MDVLSWNFLELKYQYKDMVEKRDPRVVRGSVQVCLGDWFWSILSQAHRLSAQERDILALNVLGDYRKLSMNPSHTHRKRQAPAA